MPDQDAVHVLRVITRLNIGGPARQALLLSRELEPEYRTTLVSGTPSPEEGELTDPRVPVTRAPLVRAIRPDRDVRAFRFLKRYIEGADVDIVHSHMAKAGTLARLAAFTSERRPVTVHTFHGHVLEGYFSGLVTRAFLSIERALARRTDVLIAVSEEVRDSLIEMDIGHPDRFHVVPLGFELEPLLDSRRTGHLRSALGISPDVFLVGVLGRVVPIKRHEILIRAVGAVPGAHLAIVGDGSEVPRMRSLVSELGLTGRVHFVGWRTDIDVVIPDLDVVALTSRNEGSPVSLIEAHACGVPSVATDVGGVRSVIDDGVTGFLVPRDDEHRVTQMLLVLMRDPELRVRMGIEARERARARYSAQRLIKDIRALYGEALSRRATSLS